MYHTSECLSICFDLDSILIPIGHIVNVLSSRSITFTAAGILLGQYLIVCYELLQIVFDATTLLCDCIVPQFCVCVQSVLSVLGCGPITLTRFSAL